MTTPATPWEADAVCATRLDLPWTRDRADVSAWDAETMRTICGGCPVLADCAAAVTRFDVTGGWWAGTDRDPETIDPDALVPLTWRALLHGDHAIGAQGALDLDHLAA